ncbi:MAG TPA: YfhO family protein, partial [Terriglobia bacterium]|nr:YfhO family protein [Terriglobia bacterium]
AAIGAGALVSGRDAPLYRKYLPLALLAVLALAAAVVLGLPAFAAISGRYHLLAVLAAASFLIAAAVRRRLSLPAVQLGLFALALFQIFHYSMNQPFNWSLSDPRTYQSFATAVHDGATLKQLRSDPATDFRFAAFAESPWSGNGSSVWRIPAVFGWNPITLQRYERYVREFIHTSEYTLPYGGPDHDLSSPMLDLLGVKYVVVSGPEWAKELGLPDSGKFERVAGGSDWWQLYRNPDYISRAWFYPAGYVVRGEEVAMGLMKSRWFQARHTLVLEEDAVGTVPPRRLERLPSLRLRPEDVTAASTGGVAEDPDCSERTLLFGEWVGAGNWIRFDFDLSLAPGNYVLLIRYNAAVPEPAPVLAVSARNGSQEQRLAPAVLGRTYGWRCMETRTAELGVLRLVSGPTRLVLTSAGAARVNLYAAWLVRLPDAPPPLAGPFSFADFQYSANRISLTANLSQDGFVLLNEIEYPGWEARLDGQPAPILRANGIFRALYVPAGSHRIEMRFRPRRFLWGAAISMATLAGYAGLVWLVRRKRTQTRGKIEVPSG